MDFLKAHEFKLQAGCTDQFSLMFHYARQRKKNNFDHKILVTDTKN